MPISTGHRVIRSCVAQVDEERPPPPPVATTGSIQESDTEMVVLTPDYDKTRFRLTLEPIMMLLLLGFNISSELFLFFQNRCPLKVFVDWYKLLYL